MAKMWVVTFGRRHRGLGYVHHDEIGQHLKSKGLKFKF